MLTFFSTLRETPNDLKQSKWISSIIPFYQQNRHAILHIIAIITIIIVSLSPLYLNHDRYKPLNHLSLKFLIHHPSVGFYMACSACVAAAIPLFIDFILDFFDSHYSVDRWHRIVIALCLSLPKIYYIFYPALETKVFYTYCLVNMFSSLKIFMNISLASQLFPNIMPTKYVMPIYITYFLACTLKSYEELLPHLSLLALLRNILFYTSVVLYLYRTVRYIIHMIYDFSKCNRSEKNRYFIALSHVMMPAFLGLAAAVLQLSIDISTSYEYYMTTFFLVDAVITLILSIVPGRLARIEAVESQHILNMKRTFVRFVSHEIRSPLNVVIAGLNVITKLLNASQSQHSPILPINQQYQQQSKVLDKTVIVEKIISTLKDVKTGSMIAIEILNDLLDYEKMDAGLFNVSMKYYSLQGIFCKSISCLRNFAYVKDIKFKIVDDCNLTSFDNDPSSIRPATIDCDEHGKPRFMANIDLHCIDIVIRNLITNAIKFTPSEGEVELRFFIYQPNHPPAHLHGHSKLPGLGGSSAHNDKQHSSRVASAKYINYILRVEVKDSGVGLTPENVAKLFTEFTQFDSATLQDGGGSGLGLWICNKIIMMHGGRISACSDGTNQGATFYFELPLYQYDHHKLDTSVIHSQSWQSSENNFRKLINQFASYQCIMETNENDSNPYQKVELDESSPNSSRLSDNGGIRNDFWNLPCTIRFLMVDDSKMNRKVVIRLIETEFQLKSNGIAVEFVEADDGDVAVDIVRKSMQEDTSKHIDCILIDSQMGRMHGPETVKILRNELKYSGLIIGITGNAIKEDLDTFEACGCNKALPKPVNCNAILSLVERNCIDKLILDIV